MRLTGSVCQINLISLFFLLNLNFVISTRIAKLAPVLTRQNSIRVQGIFFGVVAYRNRRMRSSNVQGFVSTVPTLYEEEDYAPLYHNRRMRSSIFTLHSSVSWYAALCYSQLQRKNEFTRWRHIKYWNSEKLFYNWL